MVSEIRHHGDLIALILSASHEEPGVRFLTPDEMTLQLGYMQHPAGKVIPPHVHNPVLRQVEYTFEVLFVKRGRVRVDFYTPGREYLESRVLAAGDTILLALGGHGFEALEELEMIEVKQGPYAGDRDKTRFASSVPAAVREQVR